MRTLARKILVLLLAAVTATTAASTGSLATCALGERPAGALPSGHVADHYSGHVHVLHLAAAGNGDHWHGLHDGQEPSGRDHDEQRPASVQAQPLPDRDPVSHDHAHCHVHVFCCVAVALAAGDVHFPHPAFAGKKLAGFAAVRPPGGMTFPLLRPPRADA